MEIGIHVCVYNYILFWYIVCMCVVAMVHIIICYFWYIVCKCQWSPCCPSGIDIHSKISQFGCMEEHNFCNLAVLKYKLENKYNVVSDLLYFIWLIVTIY